MSCRVCPEECNPKHLGLCYPHSAAFATSPFLALPILLLYRLVVAFYCLAWLVFCGYHYNDYFFLYLSNWTFILTTAYLFGCLYLSVIFCCSGGEEDDDDDNDSGLGRFGTRRFKSETYIVGLTSSDDSATEGEAEAKLHKPHRAKKEVRDDMKCYHKITWLLFTLASGNSLIVTCLFWIVRFPVEPAGGLTITIHTLGSMFLLLEVVISNIPVRLLHHLYAHVYLAIYVIFTVIYWAEGGKDSEGNRFIYPVLNYTRDPEGAVGYVFLMLIVALPLFHILFFILFRLRCWVVSKLD